MYALGGLRLTLGVFLNCFPPYMLRHGLPWSSMFFSGSSQQLALRIPFSGVPHTNRESNLLDSPYGDVLYFLLDLFKHFHCIIGWILVLRSLKYQNLQWPTYIKYAVFTYNSLPPLWFKNIFIIFTLCVYACVCLCAWVQVSVESRKRCWVPWNWGNRRLWVLGSELSSSTRGENLFSCWTISPAL